MHLQVAKKFDRAYKKHVRSRHTVEDSFEQAIVDVAYDLALPLSKVRRILSAMGY